MKYKVGDFVRYNMKNEVGLVGEVEDRGGAIKLRCWWHTGGTRALIDTRQVNKLSLSEVLNNTFKNEYVKASLLERRARLFEGGDTTDLIDDNDVRVNFRKGK